MHQPKAGLELRAIPNSPRRSRHRARVERKLLGSNGLRPARVRIPTWSRVLRSAMSDARRGDDVVQATMAESAAIRRLNDAREKIVAQLSQVIVGQADVIEELLIC